MEAAKVAKIGRSFNKFCIENTEECKPFILPAIVVLATVAFSFIFISSLILSMLIS